MTLLRPETAVMSQLLCDLPDTPPETRQPVGSALIRALHLAPEPPEPEAESDFDRSVRAGFVEPLDDWAERVLGDTR